MARPSHSQSNPITPPGATSTYIRVVHGANRKPRNGSRKLVNVRLQRTGSNSHHSAMAVRGPKNRRMTNRHMFRSSRAVDGGPAVPADGSMAHRSVGVIPRAG